MRWFVYAMSVALLATITLGVVLAVKVLKARWLVWLMLVLGFAVPMFFLWLGQSRGS